MDGRTDGRTDGWMDRWMDGWMDGLDGWTVEKHIATGANQSLMIIR